MTIFQMNRTKIGLKSGITNRKCHMVKKIREWFIWEWLCVIQISFLFLRLPNQMAATRSTCWLWWIQNWNSLRGLIVIRGFSYAKQTNCPMVFKFVRDGGDSAVNLRRNYLWLTIVIECVPLKWTIPEFLANEF